MWLKLFNKTLFGYCAAILAILAATGLLKLFGEHINATTVALAFLLIILFVATAWGSRPAVVASLVGIICFNFFFLPPFRTFAIRDPHNWIAFVAFMITAITVGQLSLLGAVWGGDFTEQTEYLRVFIGQLRKKIEPDPSNPRYILTEPWIGYRFNPE